MSVLPGEEKGRQKEGREARRGGLPCVLKTRKGGGGRKRRADRHGRSFRGGGEGRLAGAVSGERGRVKKSSGSTNNMRHLCK